MRGICGDHNLQHEYGNEEIGIYKLMGCLHSPHTASSFSLVQTAYKY